MGLADGIDAESIAALAASRYSESISIAVGGVETNPAVAEDVVALAMSDVVSGPVPLTISVDGSGSYAIGDSIVQFDWTFGGVATASGAIQSHTFTEPGVYLVELEVTSSSGGTAIDRFTVVAGDYSAGDSSNQSPQAMVAASVTEGIAPLDVVFDGSGSFDPDGQITSYVWDFGDGTGAVGPTATHVYTQPGDYEATLTVIDNDGAVTSDTVVVSVYELHTITITPMGGGSVVKTPDKTAYVTGEIVQLTAVPDPGWQFSGWSGDLAGTQSTISIAVTSDVIGIADFEVDTNPPVISNVQVSQDQSSATVTWTTNEPTTSDG